MEASIHDGSSRTTLGRWVGGLAGVAACVATILVAGVVARAMSGDSDGSSGVVGPDSLIWVGVGGLPIAFFGGLALLPAARSGGWLTALGFGVVFGLIAPPFGAIEVVLFSMLPFSGTTTGFGDGAAGLLLLSMLAVIYSYVVVVSTVPAGLLWALIVRAIPEHRTGMTG